MPQMENNTENMVAAQLGGTFHNTSVFSGSLRNGRSLKSFDGRSISDNKDVFVSTSGKRTGLHRFAVCKSAGAA